MTPESVIEIGQRTIEAALLLSAPFLITSLVVGVLVSILQTVTQINEATLTFLPKMLAMALALFLFLPWMLSIFIGFASHLLLSIPGFVH